MQLCKFIFGTAFNCASCQPHIDYTFKQFFLWQLYICPLAIITAHQLYQKNSLSNFILEFMYASIVNWEYIYHDFHKIRDTL